MAYATLSAPSANEVIQHAKDAELRAMVNTEAIMTEDVRQALIEDAMFTGMTSMSGIAIVHRPPSL